MNLFEEKKHKENFPQTGFNVILVNIVDSIEYLHYNYLIVPELP
jgi:hypothetical protein